MIAFTHVALFNRPIFFLSGITDSNLYATMDGTFDAGNNCLKTCENKAIWTIISSKASAKESNCILKYLSFDYNSTSHETTHHSGINISTDSIQNKAITFAGKTLLIYLKNYGYPESKFWDCPYDWTLSILDLSKPHSYFSQLQTAIESAYSENKEQIVMVGYSMGTLLINHFLSHYVSHSWRTKYIAKVFFIAPAAGGSTIPVKYFLNQRFDSFPNADHDLAFKSIFHIPGIIDLLPNYQIYKDTVLITDPDGNKYTGLNYSKVFQHYPEFNSDAQAIFTQNEEILKIAPQDMGVETKIIYNSAISVNHFYQIKTWENLKITKAGGDGTACKCSTMDV